MQLTKCLEKIFENVHDYSNYLYDSKSYLKPLTTDEAVSQCMVCFFSSFAGSACVHALNHPEKRRIVGALAVAAFAVSIYYLDQSNISVLFACFSAAAAVESIRENKQLKNRVRDLELENAANIGLKKDIEYLKKVKNSLEEANASLYALASAKSSTGC